MQIPFNFHTHHADTGRNGIFNQRIGKEIKLPKDTWYSAGIHPWDVEEVVLKSALKQLQTQLKNKNCLALGEIGIDKHFGTNLDLQIEVLKQQINLAEKQQKKVLIIHCIKAYQELISIKNEFSNEFIWILHGFNGSKELIESLVNQGFYFSIGALLQNPKSKIAQNLGIIPLDRLFFETDESHISIENIYQFAAKILGINTDDLENQIHQNLQNMFPSLNG